MESPIGKPICQSTTKLKLDLLSGSQIEILELGDYKLDTSGGHFLVLVYEDYVVKLPKKAEFADEDYLKEVERFQNYVAENYWGALPCKKVGKAIVMPRAPGERGDQVPQHSRRIKELVEKLKDEVRREGYVLKDLSSLRNVFYDEEKDAIWVIDFSKFAQLDAQQKLAEEKERRREERRKKRR